MNKKRYYLAYGSNLNRKQMEMRCPGAKPIGTALLEGYELLFKGSKTGFYLTIEPRADGVVPIAVWEVTAEHERQLDRYEGCPVCYYKKEIRLPVFRTNRHQDISGLVYRATGHSDSIRNSSTKPMNAVRGICTDKKSSGMAGIAPRCPDR